MYLIISGRLSSRANSDSRRLQRILPLVAPWLPIPAQNWVTCWVQDRETIPLALSMSGTPGGGGVSRGSRY